jgi:trimeric autotransporter adhesin
MQRWTCFLRLLLVPLVCSLAVSCEGAVDSSHEPVEQVLVDRAEAEIEVDAQLRFRATVVGPTGGELAGRTVFWSTENNAIASVDQEGVVSGVAPGSTRIAASSEGKSALSTVRVVAVPITSVVITPATVTLEPEGTRALEVTIRDRNGGVVTGRAVAWASDAENVARVNSSGVVTGIRPGRATITATVDGVSGSTSVRVNPGLPATLELRSGNEQQGVERSALPDPFVVRVKDAKGNAVPGETVQWRVTEGGGSISPGSNQTDAAGEAVARLTAGSPGAQRVTASVAALMVSFSASALPVPVARVELSPSSLDLATGTAGRLTAELFDANDRSISGRTVTWSTGSTAIARVDSAGVVTAVSPGATTVRATAEGIRGTASIRVTAGAPASITIESGNNQTGAPGVRLTDALVVRVADAGGNTVRDVTVAWTVEQGGGSVSPATGPTDAAGRASTRLTLGAAGGENRVRASVGDLSVAFTATGTAVPVASVTVSPSSVVLEPEVTRALQAVLRDASGNVLTGRTVSWASSATAIATVNSNGVVTGVRPGTAVVTATSEGRSGSASVRVDPGPPASIVIVSGDQQQAARRTTLPSPLVVRVTDSQGHPVAGVSVGWAVESGGGSVSPRSSQTDANGEASTSFTLGQGLGSHSASASVGSLRVLFSATAAATPGDEEASAGPSADVVAIR